MATAALLRRKITPVCVKVFAVHHTSPRLSVISLISIRTESAKYGWAVTSGRGISSSHRFTPIPRPEATDHLCSVCSSHTLLIFAESGARQNLGSTRSIVFGILCLCSRGFKTVDFPSTSHLWRVLPIRSFAVYAAGRELMFWLLNSWFEKVML